MRFLHSFILPPFIVHLTVTVRTISTSSRPYVLCHHLQQGNSAHDAPAPPIVLTCELSRLGGLDFIVYDQSATSAGCSPTGPGPQVSPAKAAVLFDDCRGAAPPHSRRTPPLPLYNTHNLPGLLTRLLGHSLHENPD